MSSLYQFNPDIWINDIKLDDYDVRNVLITDQKNAVIWDTQSHPEDINCFLPHIKDKKITVIYSHADWDHIWGTTALPYKDARIIGHDLCLSRFSSDAPVKLSEMQRSNPHRFENIHLLSPTDTFSSDLTLNFDKFSLELHHLPGHTLDSIAAFLPDKGILLIGDAIETPFPFVPPDCPLSRWIEELKRWQADHRIQTVIPSHGPIGGREQIKNTIDYLENLKTGIENKLPADVTDFYYKTHEENLRNVQNLTH